MDVRLGTQGSLFGIPMTIGKPDAIQWFLYVAVLYWGWRFYTFHRQRRPVDMQTKAREYMHKFFERRAIAHIKPPLPSIGPGSFRRADRQACAVQLPLRAVLQ